MDLKVILLIKFNKDVITCINEQTFTTPIIYFFIIFDFVWPKFL